MEPNDKPALVLPTSVVTKIDISRLARELETVDNFLLQAGASGPKRTITLPKTSYSLEELSEKNNLKLLDKEDRQKLKKLLEQARTSTPVIHISFATEPAPAFLQKILEWFRREIHPSLLLQVGLQPDIAAGCVVRTNNHYFDFSLRHNLKEQRQVVVEGIKAKGSS